MTKKLILMAVALFGCCLIERWFSTTHATLSIANPSPFFIRFAAICPDGEFVEEELAWQTLAPGESVTIHASFFRVEPKFFVFGTTADEDFIRWFHRNDLNDEALPAFDFPGDPNPEIDEVFTVDQTIFEFSTSAKYLKADEAANPVEAIFRSVAARKGDEDAFSWEFQPQFRFEQLTSSDRNSLNTRLAEATRVRISLDRQRAFEEEWGQSELFPFSLGLELSDDAIEQRGVTVNQAYPRLPGGYKSPISAGDKIWSFAGSPVYSETDLYMLLHKHATSLEGGADRPIKFEAIRGKDRIVGNTTFWFHKPYYDKFHSVPTKQGTIAYSLFDGITLNAGGQVISALSVGLRKLGNGLEGFAAWLSDRDPNYKTGPDYKTLKWRFAQVEAMRRQWFEETYATGEVASMFVNVPRAIVKKAGGRTLSRFAESTLGAVSLELGEAVIYSSMDASPIRTKEDFVEEMKFALPAATLGGIVQGNWRKPKVKK